MQKPAALLMDIGNVLIKVEPLLVQESLKKQGVNLDNIDEELFFRTCEIYEKGAIETEDFLNQMCRLTGLTGQDGHNIFRTAWNSMFPDDAEIAVTIDACRRAKEQGVRLMLFSNTNEIHIDFLVEKYPALFAMFDSAVYSHITKGSKPEPPMYLEALERLALSPQNVMYFDDKPENISAGAAFGLNAHVFDYKNREAFLQLLPINWHR